MRIWVVVCTQTQPNTPQNYEGYVTIMNYADQINQILRNSHPAAFRCLSQLGSRLYFPKGVPVQSAQAKKCRYNGTIGELKDDNGKAIPLPSIWNTVQGLSAEEVFLYQAQGGRADLRELWQKRIVQEIQVPLSMPVSCMGLTHGLSICADLFVDADTDVILPSPRWGNYDMIFGIRPQGRILNYSVMAGPDGDYASWKLNLAGIADAIAKIQTKGVLLINIPNNPVGYTPNQAEVLELVKVIESSSKPLVIVLDEAYKGMEWEVECVRHSIAKELAHLDPEKFLVVKVDGVTKELFFFGGRVAFVSFVTNPTAAAVLEEKAISSIRSTVSALPSPSQSMTVRALQDPNLDRDVTQIRDMLRNRYVALRGELDAHGLEYYPFNSAFFALVRTKHDAEATRLRLLEHTDQYGVGVGVISVPSAQAIRLSYSTVAECDIAAMVAKIADNEIRM